MDLVSFKKSVIFDFFLREAQKSIEIWSHSLENLFDNRIDINFCLVDVLSEVLINVDEKPVFLTYNLDLISC